MSEARRKLGQLYWMGFALPFVAYGYAKSWISDAWRSRK